MTVGGTKSPRPLFLAGDIRPAVGYTDDDEVLFQAARPLLVNGIEDIISRADLADRGVFLTLAPIGEQQRRSRSA